MGVHVRPCTPMGVQLCGRTNLLWAYNVRPCTPMGVLGVLGVICGRTGRTWAYKGVHGRNIAGAIQSALKLLFNLDPGHILPHILKAEGSIFLS